MKKLSAVCLIMVCISLVHSQSIILTTPATASNGLISPPPSTIVNNDTVTFCVANMFATFEDGKVICINNTGSPMDVRVQRFAHGDHCFTSNQFCWTICYPSSTSNPTDSITIAAADSSTAFHGWMTPDGSEGCCFIKYRFYNEDDTSVWAETTLKYCFSSNCLAPNLSIDENSSSFMNVYPNPAPGSFNIVVPQSELTAMIRITDQTGRSVKELMVQSHTGELMVERDGLSAGIYFCNYYLDGRLVTTRRISLQ